MTSSLTPPQPGTILHEVFLERAANASRERGPHALGAFLTLRLADQFAAARETVQGEALRYQVDATRDFLASLHPQTIETGHLMAIAQAADIALRTGDRGALWPPLLAFGACLEENLDLREATDVIETTMRLSDGHDTAEEVTARYQWGRVLRSLKQFDAARRQFQHSGAMAERLGDAHARLLGQVGCAGVLAKTGDLTDAEHALRAVIDEANMTGDTDAEARAHHALANVLMSMHRPAESVPMAYRAFELYARRPQQLRALADLGLALKTLGDHAGADDALGIVLADEETPRDMRTSSMVELLHLALVAENRVSFERWRRALLAVESEMTAETRIDVYLKLGMGYAAFGNRARSEEALHHAISQAEEHGHDAYLAQAEAVRRSLDAETAAPPIRVPPVSHDPEVRRIAERLRAMRGAVAG